MIGSILSSVGALLIIVAAIAGLGALLRRLDPALRRRLIAPTRSGTVLANKKIDRRRSLSLIEFEGDRYVLLSGGANDVLLKADTPDPEARS